MSLSAATYDEVGELFYCHLLLPMETIWYKIVHTVWFIRRTAINSSIHKIHVQCCFCSPIIYFINAEIIIVSKHLVNIKFTAAGLGKLALYTTQFSYATLDGAASYLLLQLNFQFFLILCF